MTLTRFVPAIGIAAAVALTVACGAPERATKSDNTDLVHANTTDAASGPLDEATWMISKEPPTMDLDAGAATSQSDIVLSDVYERLMQLSPDLAVKPYLASGFEWASDTELVFTLRSDVTFHDGSPMTARDVVWSMKRHLAEGAAESDEFVNVKDVTVTGDLEVTFEMAQRDAVFVEALAGDAGIVLNRKVVEQQGDNFGTPSGTDAGSGPYTLDSWQTGTQVDIVKYKDYWNPDRAARTRKITLRWGSADSITNALITGEADGAYLEDLAAAARLNSEENIRLVQGDDTRVWSLMVTERGALADPRLRRALSLAIDRPGINEAAFSGFGVPWNEPVGPGAWGFEREKFEAANQGFDLSPLDVTEVNIGRARSLVEEVGETEEIVVATDGASARTALAEAVVDAADKIGLTAKIIRIPTAQYTQYYSDPDARQQADLFADDYFVSKYDPVGFYKNGASGSTVQWVLDDPEFDQLVRDARAATDDSERADRAIDLARRWQQAMPWISTTASPNTVAFSTAVTGIPAAGSFRYYPWAADLGAAG